MSPSSQVSAAAASDAYIDRDPTQIDKWPVKLDGQKYQVFGYRDDPATGFHATVYQNIKTNEIIIAYRGTDPDIKHHTRTTVQDALVDATMVKDKINPQEAAAHAFTREMIDKAQKHGISKDQITVAGHSLGGTLAEIEASQFKLHGVTLNAYGAVDLGYGIPPGGHQVTNYVMAGDVVSAASRHFGEVKVLASQTDIDSLHTGRYLGAAPVDDDESG
jgi:putative lipase involved disintegration of autophagic bodies